MVKTLIERLLITCIILLIPVYLHGQYQKFADSYSILSTIAGKGSMDNDGLIGWKADFENGDATQAELTRPHFAMADSLGNVYIADKDAHGIRVVTIEGLIRTVAGTSVAGDNGDGPGTECQLSAPNGLWVKDDGTLYILDLGNDKIRRLDKEGNLKTVFHDDNGISLGRGIWVTPAEDSVFYASGTKIKLWTIGNGVETYANGFSGLGNICMDQESFLVATDRTANLVYRISKDGSEKTIIAGNGTGSGGGDGYAATETGLDGVRGVWFLKDNSFFVATHEGSQIWYVDVCGKIHLFLNGRDGDEYHSGDGEDYRTPGYKISEPRSIAVDYQGNVLITENDYGFVRKIRKDYVFFYTSSLTSDLGILKTRAFPNPARLQTSILIKLPEPSLVSLTILNGLGQELFTPFREQCGAETFTIGVDVSGLSAGLYFYRVRSNQGEICRKLLIQ